MVSHAARSPGSPNSTGPQAKRLQRLPAGKAERAAAASPVAGRLSASMVFLTFAFQFP